MKDVFLFRLKFIYSLLFLLALLVTGKLFFVQVLHGNAFAEKAEGQYVSPVSNRFDRGFIFFEQKDGIRREAATLAVGYTVAINPLLIADAGLVYKKLVEILPDLDEESFLIKVGKKDDPYEEIAERVSREHALSIRDLGFDGVSIYQEKWRFYPNETLAAHVLGFVGSDGDTARGQYGVERYYNDVLTRSEEELYVNFFAEVFANIERALFYTRRQEGTLVLTIEPEVQRYTENILDDLQERWGFKDAGAIIIDPRDGSIYAMVARPTFNLNEFQKEKEYSVFSNPLIENVYEMGSIIKPLTLVAGLDSGAITVKDTYVDEGILDIDGYRIGNYDGKARGKVAMQEILNQSLNTGAVYVMRMMGKKTLVDYFLSYGLGEETGIDLPNEISGLIDNLKSPREIEYATASYGQGIAMSPIAITRALSILANNGITVTPHVTRRIEYDVFPSKDISYGGEEQILGEDAVEEITRMLVRVVDEALLGGTAKIPHYSVAAKTGTAQIADKEMGGYYKDRFLHSFFGYFPAFDPQFLVFLYMSEPQGARYSSETLTVPFMDITEFLINYYEISPDR